MCDQVPEFDNEAIAKIMQEHYGIKGEITPLVSFEDQNARIKTPNGSYVLKVANKRVEVESLEMQTEVLEHLKAKAPKLGVPDVVPSLGGENIIVVDGFLVRLLTYLEGDLLVGVDRSPELYNDLGHFMGRFTKAMDGYSHGGSNKPDDLWLLDNVMLCKAHIEDVEKGELYDRVLRFYNHYEENIVPKLKPLRGAVLHNDANEQNLLASLDGMPHITGIIDFGDLGYGTLINELAVTIAYALLGEDNTQMASSEIIKGYVQEFPLEEAELEIIFDMVAMRLVQSVVMACHRAKDFPDNKYILVSQKPIRMLLKKLDDKILKL